MNESSPSRGFNRQDGFGMIWIRWLAESFCGLNVCESRSSSNPVVQKRYDTVHGKFKHDVKIGEKDELIVNGNKIKCIQASREGPKALPWKDRI